MSTSFAESVSVSEGGDLLVEMVGHARDLGPGQRIDGQGLDQRGPTRASIHAGGAMSRVGAPARARLSRPAVVQAGSSGVGRRVNIYRSSGLRSERLPLSPGEHGRPVRSTADLSMVCDQAFSTTPEFSGPTGAMGVSASCENHLRRVRSSGMAYISGVPFDFLGLVEGGGGIIIR